MQSFKIVLICIAAAILYGIIHDQFTAHICVEYFSVFHPPVFRTTSPTLLALGWGVFATWWMGAFLGILLAIAARAGARKKLNPGDLLRPILKLLLVMGSAAVLAGLTGYLVADQGIVAPPSWVSSILPPTKHARFMADWWAHNASYFVGFFGAVLLCVLTIRKRLAQTQ